MNLLPMTTFLIIHGIRPYLYDEYSCGPLGMYVAHGSYDAAASHNK